MKKFFIFIAVLLLALQAYAGMDAVDYTFTVTAATTNSKAYTLRGKVESVKITVPTGGTGTVTIASAQDTILTASSIAATATYYPRVALCTDAGAPLANVNTIITWRGTNDVSTTNTITEALYGKMPIAGAVTVSIVGEQTGTNSWTTTIVYDR